MKKIFVYFIVVSSILYGKEDFKIKDTITATIMNEVNLPSKFPEVVDYVVTLSNYKYEIYDESMKPLNLDEYAKVNVQRNPSPAEMKKLTAGGKGTTVLTNLKCTFLKAGKFYFKTTVSVIGETRHSGSKSYYYLVNVDYPTIVSAKIPDAVYYPSENDAFSFATREFNNPALYSYKIVDKTNNKVVEENKGSFVDLSRIINDSTESKKMYKNINVDFQIVGLYNNQEFKYKSTKGEILESKWDFKVGSLSIFNEICPWATKKTDRCIVNMMSTNPYGPYLFWIQATAYKGKDGATVITAPPDCRNLSVTAKPSEFLLKPSAKNFEKAGYRVIQINPNLNFLDKVPKKIELKISFDSQYGHYENTFYSDVSK